MYGDVEVSVFEVDTHHPIPVMQRVGHYSGSSHIEFADKLVEGLQVEHRTPIAVFLANQEYSTVKSRGERCEVEFLDRSLASKDIS